MAAPSPDRKEESTEPDDELEQPPTTRPPRAGFAAFRRVFSRFASAFLILFLLAAAAFAVSSGFREKVSGFVTAAFDREAPAPEPVSDEPMDTVSNSVPLWMPEGEWDLTYFVDDPSIVFHKYSRSDGSFITINAYRLPYTLSVDTENAEIRHDYLVNGNASIMSIKEEHIVLAWVDDELDVLFEVSASGASDVVDPAVVLKIAENLY